MSNNNSVFSMFGFGNNNASSTTMTKSRASSSSSNRNSPTNQKLKTGPYTFTIKGPVNAPTGLRIESTGINGRYGIDELTYNDGLEEVRSWNTVITNTDSMNEAKKKFAKKTAQEAFEEWIKGHQKGGRSRRTRRRRTTRKRRST